MYLVLNGFLCLILSLGVLYILRKLSEARELKWVRIEKNYVGSIMLSVVVFFCISVGFISALLWIISLNYENNILLLLKDSGILLAIAIALTGIFTRTIYNKVLKKINQKSMDGLYPLEYSDAKWLFVFSCLMVAIIYFKCNEAASALTAIAIIIGRFVWFDIAPEQGKDEMNSLLEVPLLYFAVLFYLLLIVVYTCFFEDVIPGCIAGIIISWIVCLVFFLTKKDHN